MEIECRRHGRQKSDAQVCIKIWTIILEKNGQEVRNLRDYERNSKG